MYKLTSDLAQRRTRQLWLKDLAGAEFQRLDVEQQLESLKAAVVRVELALNSYPKGHPQRAVLDQLRGELNLRARSIRPPRRTIPVDINRFFVDVAKENLSSYQFKALMAEAMKRSADASQQQVA